MRTDATKIVVNVLTSFSIRTSVHRIIAEILLFLLLLLYGFFLAWLTLFVSLLLLLNLSNPLLLSLARRRQSSPFLTLQHHLIPRSLLPRSLPISSVRCSALQTRQCSRIAAYSVSSWSIVIPVISGKASRSSNTRIVFSIRSLPKKKRHFSPGVLSKALSVKCLLTPYNRSKSILQTIVSNDLDCVFVNRNGATARSNDLDFVFCASRIAAVVIVRKNGGFSASILFLRRHGALRATS